MEKRQPDPSGDYGYDLAHEEASPGRPADQHPDHERRGPVPEHPTDTGGDYGYDEAHGF